MEDVVLAALLVVDDELHRDARAVRPVGERRRPAVADHVARIVVARSSCRCIPFCSRRAALDGATLRQAARLLQARQMLQKAPQIPSVRRSKSPMTDISLSFEPPLRPHRARTGRSGATRSRARCGARCRRSAPRSRRARTRSSCCRGRGRPFQRRRRHFRIRRGLPGRGGHARLWRRHPGRPQGADRARPSDDRGLAGQRGRRRHRPRARLRPALLRRRRLSRHHSRQARSRLRPRRDAPSRRTRRPLSRQGPPVHRPADRDRRGAGDRPDRPPDRDRRCTTPRSAMRAASPN